MFRKNIVKYLGIALLVALFVYVCFGNSSFFSKQNKLTQKKEIEFWTLQLNDFKPYITDVIREYEAQHPDVIIKWIDVPFSEGEKRALASVMSKKTPDLINMNPSFASTLASKGALAELKIEKSQYDSYLKESWDACSMNGKIFGVPWYITSSVTIYNKNLLKKAGLSTEKPPITYEELYAQAKIIKNTTGKYAFMPNLTEDAQVLKIFNKYDIPIVSEDEKTALFNTDKAITILDELKYLYNNGIIPPESLTQTHRNSLEKYLSGETAFIIAGSNFLKIIQDNAPEIYKNTDVSEQIKGSNGKVDFSLMNLVVPEKSVHKKEAADFALFLTNPKNQLEFCKLAPVLPSTKQSLKNEFFGKKSKMTVVEKGRYISAKQLDNALKPLPSLKNRKDLFEIVDYATQEAILNKDSSINALNKAVKSWNEILKN